MKDKVALSSCFDLVDDVFDPQVLTDVNDSQIMVVKVHGSKVPWHTHENEDELFWVIEGSIDILLRDKTIQLNTGEMYKVCKGIEHRIDAKDPAKIVLIESKQVKHTGEVESEISKQNFKQLFSNE